MSLSDQDLMPEPEPNEMDPSKQRRETGEPFNVQDLHAPIIREQAEPRDGFEPVPPWMSIFYGILLFWGGAYMALYSGGFRPDVYNEKAIYFGKPPGGADEKADPIAVGRRLYTVNCAACHQASGQGAAGKFPPLAGSEWVLGSPSVLGRILLNGLQGPVSVKGETYNGNMPAFGGRLKDDEIASILSFIRQEWGNSAPAITPEQIAFIRDAVGSRSDPWSADALQSLPAEELPGGDAAAKEENSSTEGSTKKESSGGT
ncbi:Cytochrome c-552 precursor [Planctomycetes bacterium Pan216]|uniref:Cytochrome c-552 n=1 Tax=Kolteria novifilia TaxID=2527975 RepID=A0A518B1M0_9BACT|nr:Cytochrome c-552 precursor [Planctomycetes bacterium Pan216]